MKKRSSWFIVVLVIVLLVVVVAFFMIRNTSSPSVIIPTTNTVNLPEAATITSFSINPSVRDGDWLSYSDGAKLELDGTHIKAVAFYDYPTGTDISDQYPNGLKLGDATLSTPNNGEQQWIYQLPKGLLLTNLWAQVTGDNGATMKSADLGSVSYKSK